MVPDMRLELIRYLYRRILSPLRLPIPSIWRLKWLLGQPATHYLRIPFVRVVRMKRFGRSIPYGREILSLECMPVPSHAHHIKLLLLTKT